MVDVSIITKENPQWLLEAIKYCNDRNITTEVITNEKYAKGDYIFKPLENVYYHHYIIHLQWAFLNHKNRNANRVVFSSICVYDELNKEFYMAKCPVNFWRRSKGNRYPDYTEKQIISGCLIYNNVEEDLEELQMETPEDANLLFYHEYFVKNNLLGL